MVWRGFYGHGWVCVCFCVIVNKSKRSWAGEELNWANYFPRKALSRSVITRKDKTRICNWHCYFISTSILKQ